MQHAWQELLRGVLEGRQALEQLVQGSGPARWVRDLRGPWALRFLADGHQVLPSQTERFWSRRSARQRQRALGTRHVIDGRVLWSSEVVLRR